MPRHSIVEKQVLTALRQQLIPWVSEGISFVLLDAPPKLIGTNTIIETAGKPLPLLHGIGQQVRVQRWPEENLNAMTTPYLGCVIEGEADIVTGTTTTMCRKLKISGKRWIIQMPQKSFFLTAPLMPVSQGYRSHWERANPESAYSRILWMQFQRTGIRCHFCTSDKGKHWSHPYCFIYSNELYPLAATLIHEMTHQTAQYVPLVYFTLNTILHYMVRSLTSLPGGRRQGNVATTTSAFSSPEASIQEAVNYIDQNLNQSQLSVERIARQVHFSPQHLARIFKREKGLTVMQFVTRRRMELARQLLLESKFSIRMVADYSGYLSPSSFIKVFIRHFGVSPATYRSIHQDDVRFEQ